jgi:hypothetical protein
LTFSPLRTEAAETAAEAAQEAAAEAAQEAAAEAVVVSLFIASNNAQAQTDGSTLQSGSIVLCCHANAPGTNREDEGVPLSVAFLKELKVR